MRTPSSDVLLANRRSRSPWDSLDRAAANAHYRQSKDTRDETCLLQPLEERVVSRRAPRPAMNVRPPPTQHHTTPKPQRSFATGSRPTKRLKRWRCHFLRQQHLAFLACDSWSRSYCLCSPIRLAHTWSSDPTAGALASCAPTRGPFGLHVGQRAVLVLAVLRALVGGTAGVGARQHRPSHSVGGERATMRQRACRRWRRVCGHATGRTAQTESDQAKPGGLPYACLHVVVVDPW